jgi:serine/threonine protein kinase/tetratricopeptide (TPR) repeat protein
MTPTAPPHPPAEELAAFVCGCVPEEAATAISLHLAGCEACRTVVDGLPPDTLLSLLRKGAEPAGGAATIAPLPAAPAEVPCELADHPRYRVLELLGSGGMGAVYKAEHRRMERPVALKVMSAGLMTKSAMVERFHREAKAAARLTHANIVTAFDADQAGDAHFLVMEFVEGQSLARHVQQQGPLPAAQACAHIRQAALGLEHAFEHGMVHRDIKPHNLMLTASGQVKILDFGLARFVRETAKESAEAAAGQTATVGGGLTEVGTLMGTADFIAPEQANDPRQADIRADIYSLGCTLYFLLTGQVPFPEGTAMDKVRAHAGLRPRLLGELQPNLPADLVAVVDKMMAKDPAQRYQTPAEAAAALAPFTGQKSPLASFVRRRKRLLTAAGLLAAATILAAAVFYIRTDHGEFTIETDDPDLAVAINNKGITVHDQGSGRKYQLQVGKHDLRSGRYEVDATELGDGVTLSTPAFKLQRGGKERLVVTVNQPGDRNFLVDDLRWFPADSTFFGARDMRVFPNVSLQQIIMALQVAESMHPQERERFWKLMFIIGNVGRVSFAYAEDADRPAKSRIYIRLTGDISHQRLEDWMRKDWPGAIVRKEKSPNGEPITIAGGRQAPAFAVVGNTDFLLAGYQGDAGKHLEVVKQALALRTAGANLVGSPMVTSGDIPPHAWVFFAGQPPKQLKGFFLFPVLPRSALLTISGTRRVAIRYQAKFADPAEAGTFAKNLKDLKQFAHFLVKTPPVSNYPKAVETLTSALNGMEINVQKDRVSGGYQVAGAAMDDLVELLREMDPSWINRGVDEMQRGISLYNQGKLPEAVASFRQALAKNPKNPSYHDWLGFLLQQQGKPQEAIAEFRRALALDANHFDANRNLASSLFAQKQYAEATAYYQKANALDPSKTYIREQAIRCFALGGTGQGEDAGQLDDKGRARLRRQALDWLQADLAALAKRLQSDKPQDRAEVGQQLRQWRDDAAFSDLRDPAALARLPAVEREACHTFWADVAALLNKTWEK